MISDDPVRAAEREADRLYGPTCRECGDPVPRLIEVCRTCRDWLRKENEE